LGWRWRKRKREEDEVEKDENKTSPEEVAESKDVTEVFEKTTLPFLTIIFLTSRAGLMGRRGENVANAGTRWWLRHFHKGESKTQDNV